MRVYSLLLTFDHRQLVTGRLGIRMDSMGLRRLILVALDQLGLLTGRFGVGKPQSTITLNRP